MIGSGGGRKLTATTIIAIITLILTKSSDRESQDGEKTENQDRFHCQREASLSGVEQFWMVFIGRPW